MSRCPSCMNIAAAAKCPHCGFDRSERHPHAGALPYETPLAGRFITGRVLGAGSSGCTYTALDTVTGRLVVIRELIPAGITRRAGLRVVARPENAAEFAERKRIFADNARRSRIGRPVNGAADRYLCDFEENGTVYAVFERVHVGADAASAAPKPPLGAEKNVSGAPMKKILILIAALAVVAAVVFLIQSALNDKEEGDTGNTGGGSSDSSYTDSTSDAPAITPGTSDTEDITDKTDVSDTTDASTAADTSPATDVSAQVSAMPAPGDAFDATQHGYKTDPALVDTVYDTDDPDEFLLLVNASYKLGVDFIPNDVADVEDTRADREKVQLRAFAERALEAFFDAMREAGITDVSVTSAYRGYSLQSYLFEQRIAQFSHLPDDEAYAAAAAIVAPPGSSEHQTALAVDMHNLPSADIAFGETEAFRWMRDNAHRFGFILRYPEDKVEITGISYEPWHYRFVGEYHATRIYEAGMCLEEYTEALLKGVTP